MKNTIENIDLYLYISSSKSIFYKIVKVLTHVSCNYDESWWFYDAAAVGEIACDISNCEESRIMKMLERAWRIS